MCNDGEVPRGVGILCFTISISYTSGYTNKVGWGACLTFMRKYAPKKKPGVTPARLQAVSLTSLHHSPGPASTERCWR